MSRNTAQNSSQDQAPAAKTDVFQFHAIPRTFDSELLDLHESISTVLPYGAHIIALVRSAGTIRIVAECTESISADSNGCLQEALDKIKVVAPGYKIDITPYSIGATSDFAARLGKRIETFNALCLSSSSTDDLQITTRIANRLWSRDPKTATANSFVLDLNTSSILINEERVSDSPARLSRSTTRFSSLFTSLFTSLSSGIVPTSNSELPKDLSVEVQVDSSMRDLRNFLAGQLHLRGINAFHLVNDPQCLVVNLLHSSSDSAICEKERSEIRALIQRLIPGAVKVEGIPNTHPHIKELFSLIPGEWRLSEAVFSADGRSARLSSALGATRIWDSEIDSRLQSLFPDGVFVNQESFQPVTIDDEQHIAILHALPSRFEYRSMRRCVVSGEIDILVVREPGAEYIAELEEKFSTRVNYNLTPHLFAPYPITDAVNYLGEYGGKIPFVTSTSENLAQFQGRGGCLGIGGSCFKIRVGGISFVADFGAWLHDDKKLELTDEMIRDTTLGIVSHIHTDHTGGLLEAFLQGFRKPLLMTKATALAMHPILREQAMRNNVPAAIIEDVYKQVVIVPCYTPIRISDNHTLTFFQGGHSLGSASVRISYTSESESLSVLYTGDYKNGRSRMYNPASIPPPSDIVITEGTYGMRGVPTLEEASREGLEAIKAAVSQGATVICPVLTFDRAQEVLMMLDPHRPWFESQDIPIHIVGGIIEKNLIYGYLAKDQPHELSDLAHQTKPWRFSQHSAISRPGNSDYSPELLVRGKGKLILVSGGMVVGHSEALVRRYQNDPSALLLLTCYQAEGTLGREILDFSEGLKERIESLPDFCMQVKRVSFSGHSSGEQTLGYLSKTVKKNGAIVLVHGTEESLSEVAEECEARRIAATVLALNQGKDTSFTIADDEISLVSGTLQS